MSRSPASAVAADAATDYFQAFENVYRLHEQGSSFSGRERHCAFLNLGGASPRFANVSATSGLDLIDDGRAAAAVDWDHDGDLDLWVANRTAPQLRFLRNDRPRDGRFLAVKLAGSSSNRDAVGARAELYLRDPAGGEPAPLVRTRYAGHGFLTQSSSWLHFGLGPRATIDRLVVRWPGGGRETFTGLEAGRHVRIVEGSGRAEPWTPPDPGRLEATPEAAAVQPEAATPGREVARPGRALLVGRPPLPRLAYRDFDGREVELRRRPGAPRLLNLWASWCLPCAAELRELEAHAVELRAAGLEVLALSVDGLDPEKATGPADAEAFACRLGASFTFALAQRPLLDKLQLLHDRMFARHIPLAVPTSLLIDAEGRLAAVYRGPVDVERLLGDVRNLGAAAEQRRTLAAPFPGRWLAPPQALSLATIAQRFAADGFYDDAILYLRHALDQRPEDPDLHRGLGELLFRRGDLAAAAESYAQVLRLSPEDPKAGHVLADILAARGQLEESLAVYRRALEVRPTATTRFNYGNVLQQLGENEPAIAQYRAALELDPDFADAHNNLAAVLLQQGDQEAATRHLEHTLRLRPDSADAHNNLGVLRLQRGEARAAAEHFARALALDPDSESARANLELARRALESR